MVEDLIRTCHREISLVALHLLEVNLVPMVCRQGTGQVLEVRMTGHRIIDFQTLPWAVDLVVNLMVLPITVSTIKGTIITLEVIITVLVVHRRQG